MIIFYNLAYFGAMHIINCVAFLFKYELNPGVNANSSQIFVIISLVPVFARMTIKQSLITQTN